MQEWGGRLYLLGALTGCATDVHSRESAAETAAAGYAVRGPNPGPVELQPVQVAVDIPDFQRRGVTNADDDRAPSWPGPMVQVGSATLTRPDYA